jgi:hypothetical protein
MKKITRWAIVVGLGVWMVGPLAPILAKEVLLQESGELTDDDAQLNDGSRYDIYSFEGHTGQLVRINLESNDF